MTPQPITITPEDVQTLHDEVNRLAALQKTLHHPGLAEAVARLAFVVARIVPMQDEAPVSEEPYVVTVNPPPAPEGAPDGGQAGQN